MNTAELQLFYPDFVPNQVLTNTQLNQLRRYLDEQTRLTRIRLVGRGVVCGLTWWVEDADAEGSTVTVCEGYGITSDGFLAELDAGPLDDRIAYTGLRTYTDPFVDATGAPAYVPWRRLTDPAQQIDLFQLIPQTVMDGPDAPDDATALVQADLDGRVLVLYLEADAEELRSCLVTDCDNKGLNVHWTPRLLLVDESVFQTWDPCGVRETAQLHVTRLHAMLRLTAEPPDALAEVDAADDLNAAYGRIVKLFRDRFTTHLMLAVRRYGKFLDLDAQRAEEAGRRVTELLSADADDTSFNQYHYGFAKDLAAAYNEFIACACELVRPCCPDDDFPRHLMLGALDGSDGYRHTFAPSPLRNVMHDDLAHCRKLFERILVLVERFDEGFFRKPADIRITPSHTEQDALGRRAVRYYYGLDDAVQACWQPRRCCTTAELWSYHLAGDEDRPVDWVPGGRYAYAAVPFFCIEGHLGWPCTEAEKAIARLRTLHNLEFELICLDLRRDDARERALLRDVLQAMDTLEAPREELRKRIRDGTPADDDTVVGLRKQIQRATTEIYGRNDAWERERLRWKLYCDTAGLEADYFERRSAFYCAFTAVFDQEAVWRQLAEMLGVVQEKTVSLLREHFLLTTRLVRDDLHELLHYLLPKELARFNFALFLRVYRRLAAHLVELRLTLSYLQMYLFHLLFRANEEARATGIAAVLGLLGGPHVREVMDRVTALTRDCHPATLGAVYYAYEQVRANDLGLFAHFARRYDGLEHLAGVEKGGTFILVCEAEAGGDGEAGAGVVVADFALAGRRACCCDLDLHRVCLPPLALPDYRIVTVPEEGRVQLFIDLLANDFEQNTDGRNRYTPAYEAGLVVDLLDEASELGGTLKLIDGGRVAYSLADPPPFVFDRFTYRIRESSSCNGSDTAEVVLLFVPPLPEEEPPEPPGTITGTVTDAKGNPLAGVAVVVENTFIRTTTAADGTFTIDHLLPGTYTLRFELAGYRVERATVEALDSGETRTVDVVLRAAAAVQFVYCVPGGEPVDVYVNGTRCATLDDGSGTPYDGFPARTNTVAIYAAGADPDTAPPLVKQPVGAGDGENVILAVAGRRIEGEETKTEYAVLVRREARRKARDAGTVELFLAVGAGDVGLIDVFLLRDGKRIALLANNVRFGDVTGYASIVPDVYQVEVSSNEQRQPLARFQVPLEDDQGRALAWMLCGRTRLVAFDVEGTATAYELLEETPPTGRVEVTVTDVEGVLIPKARVTLRGESGAFTSEVPNRQGRHVLDVPAGTYFLAAEAGGFRPATREGIEVKQGTTQAITIQLSRSEFFFFGSEDPVIVTVAEHGNFTLDQARTRIRETTSARNNGRIMLMETLAAEDPDVTRSKSYTDALLFMEKVAPNPELTGDALDEAYQNLSATLRSAIGSAREDRKATYTRILETSTHAYLDRVTLLNPTKTDAATDKRLKDAVVGLKRAGVDVRSFRNTWDGAALKADLGVASVDRINLLLR